MATQEYQLSYTASEIDEKLGKIDNTILFDEQTLTEEQKAQARANIGALGEGSSDGISSLEELLVTEILPETNPTYAEDDAMAMFIVSEPLSIEGVNKYIVNWNGTEYTCDSHPMEVGVAMGNMGVMEEGYPNTGEPFIIQIVSPENVGEFGFGAAAIPLDGSTTLTISIKGIRAIPAEYLPNTSYIVNLTRDDAGTWTADKTYAELVAKVAEGITPMAVIKEFGYQNEIVHVPFAVVETEYIVFNTTAYCIPFKDKNDTGYYILHFMIKTDGTIVSLAAKVDATQAII